MFCLYLLSSVMEGAVICSAWSEYLSWQGLAFLHLPSFTGNDNHRKNPLLWYANCYSIVSGQVRRLVKAMVFPVVMYGCESWTVKKAEHRRIDAFELWCWRRLLRVP